jgi:hypothetical protein
MFGRSRVTTCVDLVTARYGELMRRGLEHPQQGVPLLVLQQLNRFVGDDELALTVGEHSIFLPAVSKLAGDLEVAAQVRPKWNRGRSSGPWTSSAASV